MRRHTFALDSYHEEAIAAAADLLGRSKGAVVRLALERLAADLLSVSPGAVPAPPAPPVVLPPITFSGPAPMPAPLPSPLPPVIPDIGGGWRQPKA